MTNDDLRQRIEAIWDRRTELSAASAGPDRDDVEQVLAALDDGSLRVATPVATAGSEETGSAGGGWIVNDWAKKAVLLSFRLNDSVPMPGSGGASVFDKVPLKFAGWDHAKFAEAGFRAVPGAVVRRAAYVAPGVVLMPCFVNVGAWIGSGTMIDTWATVGSCAQIGRDCHISGGTGIGGVLEPLQAAPVIIEDGCFIGARSEVAEGVIVERGSVLSMGVFLGASTKIVDRATGEIFIGRVPAYSVVVPGTLPPAPGTDSRLPSLACAVIVKRVDARTRAKTSINELLRD
ncbi:MAG: 2,3,4,5-tetrahydropyridine-2,6-dicarboxylate N-succinyltransferase [Janthinobacterium lividum]